MMSQSSAFDRSETPKPRLRNTTLRFAVNVPDSPRSTTTTTSSSSNSSADSFKSRSNGRNLRFNLGGLPYVVTEFEDNRLGWKPAHTDLTGMGVLPMLGLVEDDDGSNNNPNSSQTPTMEEMIRRKLMDETSIEFAERTQLVVGSGLGGRGFTFGKPESVGTRIEKGSDLIAEGFVQIVFGWPGLPIIRAYPVPQPIGNNSHLTRAQLASLISSLVTSYFTWVLTLDYTQGIIPYIPWEYDAAPHAFLERYIRCLRLVKLGDSDMWAPVLGGRGLRIKEARWDIPRCAECERGECNKAYEHP